MSYSNFYLRYFPIPIQQRINHFGQKFTLKLGVFPKEKYNLQDIEDLLSLYAQISSEYWKDKLVQNYEVFFEKLLDFYALDHMNEQQPDNPTS